MRLLPCLVLALPAAAAAQATALLSPLPGRDLSLPPTSAALVEDATALAVNPGGLSAFKGTELMAAVEVPRPSHTGLFFGSRLIGLGVGLGFEWLGDRANTRRTTVGFSLGDEQLSLGAAWNSWHSEEPSDLSRLASWDLGLLMRPVEWLSVGAVVQNLEQPTRGTLTLRRAYDVAVGLRPFGERFTLGLDYRFPTTALDPGVASAVAMAEVWKGVHLSASASRSMDLAAADLAFQLGLTLDLERVGVAMAGGGGPVRPSYVVVARASTERYKAVALLGKVAVVDLADRLKGDGSTLGALLGGSQEDPFVRTLQYLDAAAADPDLRGVLVKIDNLPDTGWAKADELRRALLRLRSAGKRVLAVLMSAKDNEYFLATGADRIYSLPESFLAINGLSARSTFFGGTMEKIGVKWEVARVGAYKNAPDALTRTDMSAEQREAVSAYVASESKAYEAAVLEARKISPEALAQALGFGLLQPQDAKRLGLVDDVLGPKEIQDLVEKEIPGAGYEPDYSPRGFKETAWGSRRRIAVVPVLGEIDSGKSRPSPLGGDAVAGSETIVRALDRAKEDPSVVAIVLRVDSPGGGVLASDVIYRAVVDAREKKPVVASMGDVAASGGYYVSAGASEILASPTTLTGSIGVFMMKPTLKDLYEKIGAGSDAVVGSGRPEILDLYRPWSDEDRALAQKWVEASYSNFVAVVAQGRNLSREQVDQMARGRIWSGADAKQKGLVDGFGGLDEAVARARALAKISESEKLDTVLYGRGRGMLDEGDELAQVSVPVPAPEPLPSPMRELAERLGAGAALLSPGVQARMEYDVQLE